MKYRVKFSKTPAPLLRSTRHRAGQRGPHLQADSPRLDGNLSGGAREAGGELLGRVRRHPPYATGTGLCFAGLGGGVLRPIVYESSQNLGAERRVVGQFQEPCRQGSPVDVDRLARGERERERERQRHETKGDSGNGDSNSSQREILADTGHSSGVKTRVRHRNV